MLTNFATIPTLLLGKCACVCVRVSLERAVRRSPQEAAHNANYTWSSSYHAHFILSCQRLALCEFFVMLASSCFLMKKHATVFQSRHPRFFAWHRSAIRRCTSCRWSWTMKALLCSAGGPYGGTVFWVERHKEVIAAYLSSRIAVVLRSQGGLCPVVFQSRPI